MSPQEVFYALCVNSAVSIGVVGMPRAIDEGVVAIG